MSLLLYVINSLRVSEVIPQQVLYMPLITIYFSLSVLHSFLSILWFAISDSMKTKQSLSVVLSKIADLIEPLFGTINNKVGPKIRSEIEINKLKVIKNPASFDASTPIEKTPEKSSINKIYELPSEIISYVTNSDPIESLKQHTTEKPLQLSLTCTRQIEVLNYFFLLISTVVIIS